MSPKTSDSYFVDMMYVELLKNFFYPIRATWWLLDSFWHPEAKNKWWLLDSFGILRPKTSDSYFVDMMYVELNKNFLLADSSELMAVRLILASWAQKQVIPTL